MYAHSSLCWKNYREANEITKLQVLNKNGFGSASLNLWNLLPQNIVDGLCVQKSETLTQGKTLSGH